jgi:NTE family protein
MERALVLSGGGARGSFQAGVLKFLQERDWKPDLICGSSVGAINAVAVGSGMTVEKIIRLWETCNRRQLYRLNIKNFLTSIRRSRSQAPLIDTTRLKELLQNTIDFDSLRKSETEIVISAVNMATGTTAYFDHKKIGVEHIMASSAVPIVFPWQAIKGAPFWDGGVMANTPILPALTREAKEIVVVLLSPVGASMRQVPKSLWESAELAFEHLLIGSYSALSEIRQLHEAYEVFQSEKERHHPSPVVSPPGQQKIIPVAPERMLGFRSLANFSKKQARRLIREGYACARKQLRDLI